MHEDILKKRIESMPNRIFDLITYNGSKTKYLLCTFIKALDIFLSVG